MRYPQACGADMLFKSKLMQRFIVTILIIFSVTFTAIYFYSVPLIKEKVFEIERTSSRVALDSVFSLASKMYFDTEKYRSQALASRKQHLRTVVSLTESYLQSMFDQVTRGEMSLEEARKQAFERIRSLKYGSDDYIWIADYNSIVLSHPDPRYHGADTSRLVNSEGEAAIPEMVNLAVEQGEGFYHYKWSRLREDLPQDKVSFIKNYPQWGFVVGSGVYLDDLKQDVLKIREEALQELREGMKEIKIASTGYLFIFDASINMLIHPNPNIDGTNFLGLTNPVTGQSIAQELIRVANTGKELYYKWDRPDDPGNYNYEKLSLVRYLPGFDWYIGSSVYVDELKSSSEQLSERILTIATIAMIIAVALMFLFAQWVTRPIQQLADTAVRISSGELNAKSGINRDDEVGLLARTFDDMVDRLGDYIQNLDSKVESRTQALAEKNEQLLDASASVLSAKEELTQVEERQRLILDALPAQIAYLDGELNYLFVNQGYAAMFNQDKQNIIGQPAAIIIGDELYADMARQINAAFKGANSVQEYRINIDGKDVITKRTLIPCYDNAGAVNGLLTLAFDITAEKEAERQLTEAQRMNAVGQMAGGLAHDFNNLLTIILGNLDAASEHVQQPDDLTKYLAPAIRATRRGADITSRLLSFSRRQPLSPSLVDLNHLIMDTTKLISSSMPGNITINHQQRRLTALPFVDPGRLEDALVNLAFNARDAMPEGGELSFSATAREVSEPLILDEPVTPGHYVEIQVCDSGSGFSDETLIQAFEPFFTTKTGGAGSGLGLSMVYGFVKQSKGYISIHSEQDQGSTISLLLPARPVEQSITDMPETASPSADESLAGKLILLVEDNPDVRDVVRQQLTGIGFDVVDAASADEAVNLIPLLPDLYALVSDIMLPGSMNGIELGQWLRSRTADSKIVLISGYSYQQSSASSIDPPFTLLEKPFASADLKKVLLQL